jgi:uncharacterized protein YndB with AHSA1/START domain
MTDSRQYLVDRTVVIRAQRSTVFRFFTDSARFADWWGQGSTIEGVPGGSVHIRYPNGETAGGKVLEVVPNQRIVFTYGYDDPAKPMPRGATRVTVTLDPHVQGTELRLVHELADEAVRNEHDGGWRYQLALFANVVAREQHAEIARRADQWLALWAETDAGARARILDDAVVDDVGFRDAYAALAGRKDLAAHITASQHYMPGVTLKRVGEPRACQGTALVDWTAHGPDGTAMGRGTNVFEMAPDGRVAAVVGFWGP